MKALLALTLFLSLLSSQNDLLSHPLAATGAFETDSTTATLREQFSPLAQMWMRAYNSNDSATLASMYAIDAEYISSHVKGLVVHGRDRVIANFQNGIKMGGHIDSISILSVQSSCDLATILCKYEATNNGQKAIGRNLLVVKKVNNQWVIVLHMTVV